MNRPDAHGEVVVPVSAMRWTMTSPMRNTYLAPWRTAHREAADMEGIFTKFADDPSQMSTMTAGAVKRGINRARTGSAAFVGLIENEVMETADGATMSVLCAPKVASF